jgi:hypothetical protein
MNDDMSRLTLIYEKVIYNRTHSSDKENIIQLWKTIINYF